MAFKFAVVSRDGDVFETFEASRPDWKVGDPVILAGNRHFRVTAMIPLERMAESLTGRFTGCLKSSRSNRSAARPDTSGRHP